MSVLPAANEQDTPQAPAGEVSYLACRNVPEACPEPPRCAGAERGAPWAPSEVPSDGIRSVSLAAILALMFVVVSLLLLHHDGRCFRFGACGVVRPNQREGGLGPCHLLDPNQPRVTWQTPERVTWVQPNRPRPRGRGSLVAIAVGDAGRPFLCLVKVLFPFKGNSPRFEFVELPWRAFFQDRIRDPSATEADLGRCLVP